MNLQKNIIEFASLTSIDHESFNGDPINETSLHIRKNMGTVASMVSFALERSI